MYNVQLSHYIIMHVHADIDECAREIDNCNRSGSTPAACINRVGDYYCSCDSYVGYMLASDNVTCEGF